MPDSVAREGLQGLAASIDELFRELESRAEAAPTSSESAPAEQRDVAPPPSPAQPLPDARSPLPAGEQEKLSRALDTALSAYLSSAGGGRTELARGVRRTAEALEQAGDLTPVAEAVERLALEGEGSDEEALALAVGMLTPGVAQAVAHRVGAVSRDEVLKAHRLRVVGRLGEPMVHSLAAALTEASERGQRRMYVDAMIALGERALPVAEAMTLDTRWFVVRNAMRVLREVAGEKAVPHFTAALGHDDARVRREALLSLAYVRGEGASLLVPTKISDPDPEVRQAAAMACGEIRVERAVKPLLEQLDQEEDVEVQTSILLALGQIGDPGAVHAIEKRTESGLFGRKPEAQVRIAAYHALASIGTPHARKVVESALTDRDPEVRVAVSRFSRAR